MLWLKFIEAVICAVIAEISCTVSWKSHRKILFRIGLDKGHPVIGYKRYERDVVTFCHLVRTGDEPFVLHLFKLQGVTLVCIFHCKWRKLFAAA